MKYLRVVRLPCFFILFFYLTLAGSLPRAFADKVAKKGDNVSIEYKGSLDDGTVFDSSKNHDKPFQFIVGSGQVIPGFDKAVTGMKLMVRKIKNSPIKCCALNFPSNQNPSQEWGS